MKYEFLSKAQIKKSDWLEIISGRVLLIYSARQGLKITNKVNFEIITGSSIEHSVFTLKMQIPNSQMMMKVWCFTSLSILYMSYPDNGKVIMIGSLQ